MSPAVVRLMLQMLLFCCRKLANGRSTVDFEELEQFRRGVQDAKEN